MSDILASLLPFVPPHLARKLIAQPEWNDDEVGADQLPGAMLFADISGFTPLTEQLAAKGKEGPEELTHLLNRYFRPLIDELVAESGEVVKFSGDALMALFPAQEQSLGHAVRRAYQAANAIQARMALEPALNTSVGLVQLSMKIGIGVGQALAMEVGGLLGRWEYVVAGEPVRQAAMAESQAQPGEVVLSEAAEQCMHPQVLQARRVETVSQLKLERIEAVERALRRFVPGAVLGWLEGGGGGTLRGVLRPMTVLFIGLKDVDFAQVDTMAAFHRLVRNLQRGLYRFEGSLNKVAVDDKGTVIMALFGAPPLAHEDDALRGVKAALEIQALAHRDAMSLAIGVTTGAVFTGMVGGEARFEYTVMGDSVNLAARLMKHAGPGQILCDLSTYHAASGKVRMEALEPLSIKGKDKRVKVFRPNDAAMTSKIVSGAFRPPPMMLGREQESQIIQTALTALQAGQGQVLLLEGGAGMGKSRLLLELEIQAKLSGLRYLSGLARSMEKAAPLRAWRDVFETLFELDGLAEPRRRRAVVEATLESVLPAQLPKLSSLGEWLNLGLTQGTQEFSLDPRQRADNQLSLLHALLLAWAPSQPLVIALDDVQWLDLTSWSLALQLANSISAAPVPVLLALAGRPMERGSEHGQKREQLAIKAQAMTLHALSHDDMTYMVADRLKLLPTKVPVRLVNFLYQRSEGAPFVAEELLRASLDQGLVEVWQDDKSKQLRCRIRGRLSARAESLPGSVRGLILSRIDRLSDEQQTTLKVAAVLGRSFAYQALVDIVGVRGADTAAVLAHLDGFVDMELVDVVSTEPDLVYRFRHRVTQEVAYDSMLFSYRRELHLAAAQWFEHRYGDVAEFDLTTLAGQRPPVSGLSPYLDELANHYRCAGDPQRELLYQVLAGRQAARAFHNDAAVEFFTRALEIVAPSDGKLRFAILANREAVFTVLARRSARKADLQAMQEVARELGDNGLKAQVAIRQAIYQFSYGRHQAAAELADSAVELAQANADSAMEAQGRRWLGMSLQIAGRHQEARQQMERALNLAQMAKDDGLIAVVTTQLARFAEQRGEFNVCLNHCEQALALARTEGALAGEAMILRRMGSAQLAKGEVAAAKTLADEALALQQRIGDRRQEGLTLGLQGRIAMAEGDYAKGKNIFERSLGLGQEIHDRQGQHKALMLLGQACFHLGAYDKARLCYVQALDDASDLAMAFDQAEVSSRLVLLEHCVGENEKAKQHGLQAVKTLSALNHPALLAATLTYLGHAMAELGDYDAAAAAYGNALRLRRQLGQSNLLMETVAGAALLDFKRGRHSEALEKVDAVLAHFESIEVSGVTQPFRIYQTCFEILQHHQDERAATVIERAHAQLQTAAEAISDTLLRQSFLQSVLENRAVAYYHQGLS